METELISKRPLLPPAIGGTSGSNFNPRNTRCIPVVNPAMAGSPSLILNPAVSGKHFETASTDYAFNKLRWHIYITPAFCQEINPLSARTKRRKGFNSVNLSFEIFLFLLTVTAFFYYNFIVIVPGGCLSRFRKPTTL